MGTTSELAIRLLGVEKRFGETAAVEELDLEVPRGSMYGLLGPNGAGKTTTIRLILDIVGPDAGTVEVLGRRVDDEVRSRVGYLPEERGLYPKMTALDHLEFLGRLKGMDRSSARSTAGEWLDRFDLLERAGDTVETYSKGMRQKVQFIATLLHRPDLLILDEPFSGLDPLNVDLLKKVVLEAHDRGTTVVFSTHRIEDAEELCDRVCMIAGARKVLDGEVDAVKARYGHQEVALVFRGEASFLDRAPGVRNVTDRGTHVAVRLEPGADPNDLLRAALESGVRVRRFEVGEPPLREIFLAKAREAGLSTPGSDDRDGGSGHPARGIGAQSSGSGNGVRDPDHRDGGTP